LRSNQARQPSARAAATPVAAFGTYPGRHSQKVEPGHTATLTCEDGNRKAVCGKAIEYTDFPLPAFELYFTNSTISLPSEY
jgi:hypothetical protein